MRQNMITVLAFLCWSVLLQGCGTGNTIYLETASQETADINTREGSTAVQEDTAETAERSSKGTDTAFCYVYVCGAVERPGVYMLPEGSRIYEAVALAGGMTQDACESSLNQAEVIVDGEMIRIMTSEEASLVAGGDASGNGDDSDGRIDLNRATEAELLTLPGIGSAKASGIIAYRTQHGDFSAIEEIMNVEGIKEGIYNRIKDYIKVN